MESRMNENDLKEITVDDFNVICRVCLKNGEDMVDIFKCGIENQLMEVTSLKMELDDKLPKTLCQKCNVQINEYSRFLQQAKSSDVFLRSLLPSVTSSADTYSKVAEDIVVVKNKTKRKFVKSQKKSKIIKKVKSDTDSDKMYLIVVPEADGGECKTDSEIYIKDLSSETDNIGLTNYCRTLVRSHFSDHTYPKEQKCYDYKGGKAGVFNPNCLPDLRQEDSKTYKVNLHVYECSDCKATFEEFNHLNTHLSNHGTDPPFVKNNFVCPICNFSVGLKVTFINHLRAHKENGFFFVKVNSMGKIMSAKENEEDLFIKSLPKHTKDCKVFSVTLNSINCTVCSQNIQSVESVPDHLKSCHAEGKSDIKFSIKYTCPICLKVFIDKEKNFMKHLGTHKKDNYHFIKVGSSGELIQVAEDEKLFVPLEEATKLFGKKSTVFEILDINSCGKCDYLSDSFSELCKHNSTVHFQEVPAEISFSCPVCLKHFKSANIDENQNDFYEHLKVHKNEGASFVLITKNGTVSNVKEKYSDVFTPSLFLQSLINSHSMIFQKISPELVILDHRNFSRKYTCDLCSEKFKKKQEIIVHLRSHQAQEAVQDNVYYICEKCGKKCLGKVIYKKHFLKHSRVLPSICRRPICMICNKKFANRATLNGHMRHHLKEESGNQFHTSLLGIICEKCGRSFSNNASLTKHKKMHLKEKENAVLKCEICDRDFFRQTSFDRHKSAHLNPKYFECGICKLPLSSVASLQKHSEIHNNGSNTFDCKACQLSFLTQDSLTAHQTHTGHYIDRKPLECNVCHEKFFIGRKFSQHIKTHPKYKMGECTLCGKRLSTIQSLMLHMGRHFESNSILCPHCGKQFYEERNYHRHLLTHEGIKPFPCDMEGCKKSFYTLFELNRHKKYHNNTRDFRCLYCSKSFHEANHLTVHIRTHTGERPYTCPHCNKGFVTRTHCKHHIKLVHQGVGYDLIRSNISKKVTVFEAVEAVP